MLRLQPHAIAKTLKEIYSGTNINSDTVYFLNVRGRTDIDILSFWVSKHLWIIIAIIINSYKEYCTDNTYNYLIRSSLSRPSQTWKYFLKIADFHKHYGERGLVL